MQSSGSLENNENIANIISQSLQILSDASHDDPFKRISFLYSDHAYVVVKSGKTIQIIHKQIDSPPSM